MTDRAGLEAKAKELDIALAELNRICSEFRALCLIEDQEYRELRKISTHGKNHSMARPHPLFEKPDTLLRQATKAYPVLRRVYMLTQPSHRSAYEMVKEFPNSFRPRG